MELFTGSLWAVLLKALRLGLVVVAVDSGEKDMLDQGLVRAMHYFKLISKRGLMCEVGGTPVAPAAWELNYRDNWERQYATDIGIFQKNGKRETKRRKAKELRLRQKLMRQAAEVWSGKDEQKSM